LRCKTLTSYALRLSFSNIKGLNVSDFDFILPPELIAQEPAREREEARLLLLERATGALRHASVSTLPELLDPGDVLVVNNTRVFPARLLGRRLPSGGNVECLLVRRLDSVPAEVTASEPNAGELWEGLVHPGQKLKEGARIRFEGGNHVLEAEVQRRRFYGRRVLRLWSGTGAPVDAVVDAIGHVPLPPYIKRTDRAPDRERYQTVFASARGSIAAPTAGLHFTQDLFRRLGNRGVEVVEITLHVGYGTFQPVRVADVEGHQVEAESYEVSEDSAKALNRALDDDRRVIAVGTTTTRTLEAVGLAHGGRLAAGAGTTDLFIFPGFAFRIVRGLMTNFHLPRSSLLMLVSAFAGRERALAAYAEAIGCGYRFYSYGDAMLIL
jgi:S-adenosylmethionine:tRNA ribosyltransferase-isomerase